MSPHAPLLKQIPVSLQDLSFWPDNKGQELQQLHMYFRWRHYSRKF
jgi:hypothetical protein